MNQAAANVLHTVAELLESGTRSIGDASDTPDVDARVLLQALLRRNHAWLIAHGGETVEPGIVRQFHDWVKRRSRSEPVAYITGRKAFWTLDLKVTPDVLVPRPETEFLVQRGLERIPLTESVFVADLGTGSGAIGLSIAAERPLCKVIATDSSEAALKIAEQNKGRHGLRNIAFRLGNWYEPLGRELFSLVICNPPYVPWSHYEAALTYEPRAALFSGDRGIDALEMVIGGAGRHLEAGGWLLVEHGFDQKAEVQGLFRSSGFDSIATLDDFAGHPRVTEGRKAFA
jgi:release factor glutamine methyltransferase